MTEPSDSHYDPEYHQTNSLLSGLDKQAPDPTRNTSPVRNIGARFFDYSYDFKKIFDSELVRPLFDRLFPLVIEKVVEQKQAKKQGSGRQTKTTYKLNKHTYRNALGLILANFLDWNFTIFNERVKEECGLARFSLLYSRAELRGNGVFEKSGNKVTHKVFKRSNYALLNTVDALEELGYLSLTKGYTGVASSMYPSWEFMRLYGELNDVVSYDQGSFVSLLPRAIVGRVKSYDFIRIREYEGMLKTKKVVLPKREDTSFGGEKKDIDRYRNFLEKFEFSFTPVKENDRNFASFAPPYNIYRQYALDVLTKDASYGGGRFYGVPWQSISKLGRKTFKCRLDNQVVWESMIELDYPSHHPRLLYVMNGLAKEQIEIEDLYAVYDKNGQRYARTLVKHAVLCLIFSNSTSALKKQLLTHIEEVLDIPHSGAMYPKEREQYSFEKLTGVEVTTEDQEELYRLYVDFKTDEKKWKEFYAAMKESYAPIWGHISGKMIWKALQLIDSEITHYIHTECTRKSIPVLSVHDSYIVPENKKEQVIQIAVEAYRCVLKRVWGVDVSEEHVPRLSE